MSDGRPTGDLPPAVSRSAPYAAAPVAGLGHAPAPAYSSHTMPWGQPGLHAPADVAPAWPFRTHLELAAFPSAVSCARAHVRSVAREWGLTELADTAELLASELATNAIRASERLRTRSDLESVPVVRIWLASDQTSIAIHVWDGDDEMPLRKDVGPDDESGRGLVLVESLAQDWGAYREQNGKAVWVVIIAAPCEPDESPADPPVTGATGHPPGWD
jgi:anti-sigma regulatory factor (Ser/Thr protein kinase)